MATPLIFDWSAFSGSIAGGVSQDTGGINVSVSYNQDGNGNNSSISTSAQFTDNPNGADFASNSSLQLGGSGGDGNTSVTTIDFDAVAGSGFSDEVDDVTFRINDFDTGSWIDVITVRAYDANDNLITVDLTWNGTTFSGTEEQITSNVANGQATTETGSILVEIAGPVSRIEIDYDNDSTGGQALWVTDIHFDAVDLPDGTVEGTAGDDTIDVLYTDDPERDMVDNNDAILAGDTGNDDLIFGYGGNDAITAGAGDDEVYGGAGNDTINIAANEGTDTIFGGEDADGLDVDTLSLSDTTGTSGAAVTLTDSEDGTYSFPASGGSGTFEQIEAFELTDQDDQFDGSAASSGATVYAGAGSDVLAGGTGDDTLAGDGGDDLFILEDGFGNDQITGGEADETDGDVLFASDVTTDLTLDLSAVSATDNESGTLSDGTSTATFEEIEVIGLGTGDDSVIGSSGDDMVATNAGEDVINLGAGNDALDLGDHATASADGEADTIILQDGSGQDVILNFDAPTDNGDGTFTGIDVFDVTDLHDASGAPVTTTDVTVTDDGSGNALLSFPNGESVTLVGISPTDADNTAYLNAIGIPTSDGTVSGTDGADTIDAGYLGDPDGDLVDDNDAILPGDTGNDDLIISYGGDDSITAGAGDDDIRAGDDNDTVDAGADNDTVFAGDGNDSVTGNAGDDVIYGDGIAPEIVNGGFDGRRRRLGRHRYGIQPRKRVSGRPKHRQRRE